MAMTTTRIPRPQTEPERSESGRERLRRLHAAADRERLEAEQMQKEAFLSRVSNRH